MAAAETIQYEITELLPTFIDINIIDKKYFRPKIFKQEIVGTFWEIGERESSRMGTTYQLAQAKNPSLLKKPMGPMKRSTNTYFAL